MARIALAIWVFALLLDSAGAVERMPTRSVLPAPPDAVSLQVASRDSSTAKRKTTKRTTFVARVCSRLESEARANDIPEAFFALLIWLESGFNPRAVSHKGARGIAQFMPGTARLVGLKNPFDPDAALAASARHLADLRDEFGNLGLAAAAYNAGRNRVRRWRNGKSRLPKETQSYVVFVTGMAAKEWTAKGVQPPLFMLDARLTFQDACRALPIRRPRGAKVAKWQPWGVHIAANFSRMKAMETYARVQQQFSDVLGDRLPMIISKVNLSMGSQPRYNIRFGADSREEADEQCARLRQAGGKCIVIRN